MYPSGLQKEETSSKCVFASKAKNLVSVGQAKPAHAVGSILKENVADEARNHCG